MKETKMSKNKVASHITDRSVVVNYDNQTHIVLRTDPLADRLIDALRNDKLDLIPELVSASKRVEKFSQGTFVVKDGEILVNGAVVSPYLGSKIVKFSNDGLPYQPLVKFAANLQSNPSYRAVNELYQFLEKNDHPLTSEGNFIAYKRVRKDFKDIHSGTFDNSVGTEPSMPRNQVNEDCTQTCSDGLHVANWNYAHTRFASSDPATDVMLEVEVNPADVVSIPVDYNQSKMRVCRYKVLGVVDKEHSSDLQLRSTVDSTVSDEPTTEDSEMRFCADCSCSLTQEEDEYCVDCAEDHSDDDIVYCRVCGEIVDDGYNICQGCYDDEDEEDDEEERDYPFESELD
jgi:hypothetical protein